MKRLLVLIIFQLTSFPIFAQLLTDTDSKQLLIKGLDKLYNYEFKEAETFFQKVKVKYPNHPVTPLLIALQIQWQNIPLEQNLKVLNQYMFTLEKCRQLAENLLKDPNRKAEATFFLLASHGYIALSYTYKKEQMKAANEARKAYGYMKDGFEMMERNPEFYFTSGLYNYYRIQYPETHPIVKPLVIFFEDGNKKVGINQMEYAVNKSIFSRIEAAYYLMGVNIKYEVNYPKALIYASLLHDKYPNNIVYLTRYVETLTMTGKYEEVVPHIQTLRKINNSVSQIASNLFDGLIAEKGKKNDKQASDYYMTVLKYIPDDRYTNDYYAMAYAGLARIAIRAGNRKRAEEMYDKCLSFAENKGVIAEARRFKEK